MQDFESLSEFRSDGRKPGELRDTKAEIGIAAFRNFNGSSRIKQGLSEVLCFIDGPKHVS